MKNRLIISITDIDGTKSYNFSNAIKKIIKYSIISLTLIIVVGILIISILSNSLDKMENKKNTLNNELKSLKENNLNLNSDIIEKAKELKYLSLKIEDVEKIVGIIHKESNDTEINQRVDLAKLTYVQKQYMLKIIPNGYPIPKKGVSSSYGWRTHPVIKEKRDFHPGIDLRSKMRTKVRTTADGIIKYAGWNTKGYGNMVIISHNLGFETLYAHLHKVKVKIGHVVNKGDIIALSGNTGLSSGPHLHYEVRYAQRALNPVYFLKWSMKNYNNLFKKSRKVKWQSLINQIMRQTAPLKQLSSLKEQ